MHLTTELVADRSAVLEAQYANAERLVNGVRIFVIGALAIAAAAYAPHLTASLNVANAAVVAPVLAWAIIQHFVFHKVQRRWSNLSLLNAMIDTTAVSALLASYGLFGLPDLAVKSPLWAGYFLVLAARPFTGSARRAALTGFVAAAQYTAVVLYFVNTGALPIISDPLVAMSSTATSWLVEMAKVLLMIVGAVISTYATGWIDRTLTATVDGLRASETRFRTVFERSAVGIAMLDDSARIVETNTAFERFLGFDSSDVIGRAAHDFAVPDESEAVRDLVANVVGSPPGTSAAAELQYLRKDGRIAWGSVTLSHADGSPNFSMIAMVQDVTERKELEKELLRQAFHDSLTGLANRSLFRDRVAHALERSVRAHEEIAVVFLDLDNFKQVNDTLGHGAGDRLLSAVARRLLNATRGCDTVARLGGDEFAVLLENVRSDADATIVADRIKASLQNPIQFDNGRTANVTASIGIARARAGEGSDELLRNADVAMYGAKAHARGNYVLFDPSMHAALVDRVALETDLRAAIDRSEISVAYQPIVGLETGTITGVEALMRWTHPARGSVPPAIFIPVAEETGLIVHLGGWVLREACQRAAGWNAERPGRSLSITVNVSEGQLTDGGLVGEVAEALRCSGLEPRLLILEFAESVIVQNSDVGMERLRQLRALGVRLAIDDFGTRYSSLSQLQKFPVDVLKIDRSFTAGISHDMNSAAVTRTIIALGNMLTLRTVAEGVETSQQHSRLKELGCLHGQGYLFSHPVDGETLTRMLENPIMRDQLALGAG